MIRKRINFGNREALASGLARKVAQSLSAAVSRNGKALLAVSGGTTPGLFFDHLSRAEISWEKVTITLVDERQVPHDHPRSNARFVTAALMQNHARSARFVPLFPERGDMPDGPFDCAVLGMGNDGHTASFFPGGDTLHQALDSSGEKVVLSIEAPGAGEPRVTYTLPCLLAAGYLALHIEGAEKLAVLERAERGSDIMEMPVRAVLQLPKPLDVYWCP